MSHDTVRNRPRRPWRARTATATALLALALVGGPSVASAAGSNTWELSGADRSSRAAAQADVPDLNTKCRGQGGNPISSTIKLVPSEEGQFYDFRAVVTCQALR